MHKKKLKQNNSVNLKREAFRFYFGKGEGQKQSYLIFCAQLFTRVSKFATRVNQPRTPVPHQHLWIEIIYVPNLLHLRLLAFRILASMITVLLLILQTEPNLISLAGMISIAG